MEQSWLTILPNLSIGVVAVLALVYVVIKFLNAQEEARKEFFKTQGEMRKQHEEAMIHRENALRSVESEVRQTLSTHLTESTHAVRENTRVLERVMNHLDGNHRG